MIGVNWRTRARRRDGFSLVEVALAAALAGIVSTSLFFLLHSALRLWDHASNSQDALQSTRVALDRVSKELRYSSNVTPGVRSVVFDTPGGLPSNKSVAKVRYELASTGNLLRSEDTGTGWVPAEGAILATGIADFLVDPRAPAYDEFSGEYDRVDPTLWEEVDDHGSTLYVTRSGGWLKVSGAGGVGPQGLKTPRTYARKDLVIETTFQPRVDRTAYLVLGFMNWSDTFTYSEWELAGPPPIRLRMTTVNTAQPGTGYALMANHSTLGDEQLFVLHRLLSGSEDATWYWGRTWRAGQTYRAKIVLGAAGARASVDSGTGYEPAGVFEAGTEDNLPIVLEVPYDSTESRWDDFRIYRTTDRFPIRSAIRAANANPEIALETSVLPR